MSSYDKLRYSFDNILKELDDICKSIDDLTDIDRTQYDPNSHETDLQKKLLEPNHYNNNNNNNYHNQNKQITINTYLNRFNLSNFYVNSRNQSPSLTLNRFKTNNLFFSNNKTQKFNYERLDNNSIYEEFKRNLSELDNSIKLSELQINKTKPQVNKNCDSVFLNEINNLRHFSSIPNKSEKPNKTNEKSLNNHKSNQQNQPKQASANLSRRKHKLPNELNISLNSVIGSVRENILSNLFPLTTNNLNNNSNNVNNPSNNCEQLKILKTSNSLSPRHKFRAKLSEVSFSFEDNNNDYFKKETCNNEAKEEDEALENENEESQLGKVEEKLHAAFHSEIDNDYLTLQEISKIECFYNSMGCYVYVSRCIAELYQIKREDEFDAMDNDPVNDYQVYMENHKRKEGRLRQNVDYDNCVNDDNNELDECGESKSNVNYMYINSGVPVIVFNYGANPKRGKDLRILLAERSTGFCMWEFKFDKLTQYENSDDTTVIRLTLNNNQTTTANTNASTNQTNGNFNSSLSENPSSSMLNRQQVLNYQNEYFEKFFNSKNRHAHKEHLLKFVIKRDCDEFCFKLMRIMNDKKNSDLFVLNQVTKHENYKPNSNNKKLSNSLFLNFSSVLICHFDFLIYNNLEKCLFNNLNSELSRSSMYSSMSAFVDSAKNNNALIKNKKYSTSTSTLVNNSNFVNGRPVLSRNESLRSSISNDETNFSLLNESNSLGYNELIEHLNRNDLSGQNLTSNNNNAVKYRKLKKSDISSPVNFSHVTHLDKPVPIGKRYKLNYKS